MAGIVPKRGLRDHDIQLVRFLPQGNVDSSFNSPVFEFGAEPATGSVRARAVQPDGCILVGGEAGHFGDASEPPHRSVGATCGPRGCVPPVSGVSVQGQG